MITFKQFLYEREEEQQTRMKRTEPEAAVNWLRQNAAQFLDDANWLYRGVTTGGSGIRLGDAANGPARKSANTSNYYTLWMDNHTDFRDWPRRSQSFIVTTNEEYANNYGDVYLVIPDKDSKIGVVGKRDIWDTVLDKNENYSIERINDMLDQAFSEFDEDPGDTFEHLIDAMKNITFSRWAAHIKEHGYDGAVDSYFYKLMLHHDFRNLFEAYQFLMKPELFGEPREGTIDNDVMGEVWVDGQAMFIPLTPKSLSRRELYELAQLEDDFPEFVRLLQKHFDIDDDDLTDSESTDVDSLSDEDTLTSSRRKNG